jgi:hypothetical protein
VPTEFGTGWAWLCVREMVDVEALIAAAEIPLMKVRRATMLAFLIF